MNEFPSLVIPNDDTGDLPVRAEKILREWGVKEPHVAGVKRYTHIFTHVRWNVTAFFVRATFSPFEEYGFSRLTDEAAFPTAFRRCFDLLAESREKGAEGSREER